MIETGMFNIGEVAEEAQDWTCASVLPIENRRTLKSGLCGGVAACVFMLALLAPISIDLANGEITFNAAMAGNGDGNFGNGKGNGGANGQNPGNNGNGNGSDGDGDGDGDGGGDTSPPAIPTPEGDSHDSGSDSAADMADADFGEAVDAVSGSPAEGPMAGTPAASLPTISQLFSMGDEAAVSAEDELELIANGWGSTN